MLQIYHLLLYKITLNNGPNSWLLGKFKKVQGAKGKRRNLSKAEAGRYGIMVGPRVELRMRSRGGKDSVVTSLVWHHKVRTWMGLRMCDIIVGRDWVGCEGNDMIWGSKKKGMIRIWQIDGYAKGLLLKNSMMCRHIILFFF